VLADDPIGYWRLGETSGTSAADEVTAYGGPHSGIYTGMTVGQNGALVGDPDRAAANSTLIDTHQIHVPSFAELDITSALSVEVWLKDLTQIGAQFFVIRPRLGGGAPHWGIGVDPSGGTTIRVWLDNNTDNIWDTGYTFDRTAGAWHLYTLTWDGSTAILYVDGVSVASTPRSGPLAPQESQDLYIARDPNTTDRCLVATIDEVAIYDTALSAARVAAHYSAGT
jgi:hypothetical protein